MKKETIGFVIGTFLLFSFYVYMQNRGGATSQSLVQHPTKSASQQTALPTPQNNIAISGNDTTNESFHASRNSLQFENQNHIFQLTSQGGCLGTNLLKGVSTSVKDPYPVSVIQNYNACKAFGFRVGSDDLRTKPAQLNKISDNTFVVTQKNNGLLIRRKFQFASALNQLNQLEITVINTTKYPISTDIGMELGATSDNKHVGFMGSQTPRYHGAVVRLADGTIKREYTPYESEPEVKTILNQQQISPTWLAVDSLYFLNAVIPQENQNLNYTVQRTGYQLKKDENAPVTQTVYEAWMERRVNVAPGAHIVFHNQFYNGPKNEHILKDFDQYKLDESIDFGFFKIIARPLYYALSALHSVSHNWGLAIILLTICINIVFFPLQFKAFRSGQKMQKIQPRMKELQEKYKDDKVALQKETMALMSSEGVNPMSGCLPILPQIPVFFGLNSALSHTFELRQAPFYFWIKDLTSYDPYFVLPILMAALMIGYQKMIPMPSMDPSQEKVMKFLPIVFSIFMVFYPSGLALYVITNTLISMVRQFFFMKRYPHPVTQKSGDQCTATK